MARTFQHLLLTSALAAALAPGAAWARFGKSDDHEQHEQQQRSDNNNGSSDHEVRSSDDSHYHEATPVGAPYVDHTREDCRSDGCCWRHSGWPSYWYEEPAPAYAGYAGYSPQVERAPDYGLRIRTELTGDLMPFSTLDGGAAGAQLRIEGPKWGIALEGRHIAVVADDGSGATDHLSFFNGFITYALLGNERGRLRLEAGGQSAFAPDLIVLSPAVGLSFAIGFGESFGLEAVTRASLLPHVQTELAAGFTWALGPLGLRMGWRGVYLNDNGLVDGVAHSDTFSGPYFGMGLAF